MSEVKKVQIKIGNEVMTLETGRIAKQANGAVFATYGKTAVIATVCCGGVSNEVLDYVPLSVEYNEKYYAAGKIPGGFNKRESRPKDKEILVSRIIDRPMRPLFYDEFSREIQIVPTTVSADQINPPDMVALIASSAAVTISDIPFNGPVAGVRVAYLNGEYIINPTFSEIERSDMDIVVAGNKKGITMVEGGAKEVSEEVMLKAITTAEPVIRAICEVQEELQKLAGKEKLPLLEKKADPEYANEVREYSYPLIKQAAFAEGGKLERGKAIDSVKEQIKSHFASIIESDDSASSFIDALIGDIHTDILRTSILENDLRVDGRDTKTVRPITCEVNVLPSTHGSALFTRGETQSLATTTLGSIDDEQLFDDIDGDKNYKSFMLHYNFPPYSVGETGRLTTGRREIGHGHLAERALKAVIPSKDDFPYTIRVVSDIMESNGSSSMATVCGGCLSLMDAGVPIKKPVAGCAMGLITSDENYSKYKILTDILGEEDHMGDMDFKVAGTKDGITAFQMDIKIAGVSSDIMKEALSRAHSARMHILDIMTATISSPRQSLNENAPTIISFKIDEKKIGAVIGQGGGTIKGISGESGANVSINDDGVVTIFGSNKHKAEMAKKLVEEVIEEPEVGKIYNGTVKRITDFGAFVEILPKYDGLCHISKLDKKRVKSVADILKVGQIIPVKLMEIDRMGRLNLSYIDALESINNKA